MPWFLSLYSGIRHLLNRLSAFRGHCSVSAFSIPLILLVCVPIKDAYAQEVIIVNPQVRVTNLSRNAVRAIFGMRLRAWPIDKEPITVFVFKDDNPNHLNFAKRVLSIFPHQLRRAWDRLVYSGTGQAPIVVDTSEEMLQAVASTIGAIGYVEKKKVNDSVRMVEVR